jgi:hypothetical protein
MLSEGFLSTLTDRGIQGLLNVCQQQCVDAEDNIFAIKAEIKRRDDVIKLSRHRAAAYESLYEYSLQAGYDQFVAEFGKDTYTKMMKEVY